MGSAVAETSASYSRAFSASDAAVASAFQQCIYRVFYGCRFGRHSVSHDPDVWNICGHAFGDTAFYDIFQRKILYFADVFRFRSHSLRTFCYA